MADFEGSLPIKTVRDDDVKLKIVDWASGSEATAGWSIDANGAGLIRAVELDIRALAFATDKVDVSGSDITVSATAFDIRALTFATDSVDVSGSEVIVTATALDIRALAFATDSVDVSGSSVEVTGNVTVDSTDLDIRDLTFATDSVDVSGSDIKLTDGTHVASVNSDGSLNVAISSGDLVHIVEYFTSAAVAKNSAEEYDYVVPAGAEFKGENILVGSHGAVKVEFGILMVLPSMY